MTYCFRASSRSDFEVATPGRHVGRDNSIESNDATLQENNYCWEEPSWNETELRFKSFSTTSKASERSRRSLGKRHIVIWRTALSCLRVRQISDCTMMKSLKTFLSSKEHFGSCKASTIVLVATAVTLSDWEGWTLNAVHWQCERVVTLCFRCIRRSWVTACFFSYNFWTNSFECCLANEITRLIIFKITCHTVPALKTLFTAAETV